MPIPSRKKDEDRQAFVSRCMGDDVMKKDYPDSKQRIAVCLNQVKKDTKASILEEVQDNLFETNANWDEEWNEFVSEIEIIETVYDEEGNVIAAEKKGKKVNLNKPFRTPGGPKKFSVYVKNDKGNVVKVNFGDPNMEIKRDDPERRKNYRARHNCDNPGPKWKANYWSCKMWSSSPVSKLAGEDSSQASQMSRQEINNLPDSDFAYIEPGGEKDDEGKTVPRSLRHFPIHDATHVRNALARLPQSKISEEAKKKAMQKIKSRAKKYGIQVSQAQSPGLWENIRKKRERMGKKYKPARPGDPDRPDPEQWKKLTKGQDSSIEEIEKMEENPEYELMEYKADFLEMILGSLNSIKKHVDAILENISNESVKENLTEPFLQATAALAEDYVMTIHNYVMYNTEAEDEEDEEEKED